MGIFERRNYIYHCHFYLLQSKLTSKTLQVNILTVNTVETEELLVSGHLPSS